MAKVDYKRALDVASNIGPGGRWRRPLRTKNWTRTEIEAGRRIWALRRARAQNRPLSQADLARAMQARTVEAIRRRYEAAALSAINRNIKGCAVRTQLDLSRAAALVTVEGYAQYSRRFGARYTQVAVLVVYDHDTRTRRALRVGPSVRTIDEALLYLMPAEVRRALAAGRTVLRQGDIYLVPSRRPDYRALEGTRHRVIGDRVVHPEHGELRLPGPCRAYRQMMVRGGWGGGRTSWQD